MLIVREVMYCKPGQVRALVNKFKAANAVMQKLGFRGFRISTDVVGEQFWTCVLETEVESLVAFSEMEAKVMADPDARKAMEGYHDLVERGRREIYRVES